MNLGADAISELVLTDPRTGGCACINGDHERVCQVPGVCSCSPTPALVCLCAVLCACMYKGHEFL
eukprot:scaffold36751_cov20-Tisochrysis_lutea.AAC.8